MRSQSEKGHSSAGSPDRPTNLPAAPRAGSGLCLQAYVSPGHVACQTVSCNCVTGSQSSPPTSSHWSPGSGGCRSGGHDCVAGSGSGRLACFSSIGPRASGLFSRGLSHFHPPHPLPSALQAVTFDPSEFQDALNSRARTRRVTSGSPETPQGVCPDRILCEALLNE